MKCHVGEGRLSATEFEIRLKKKMDEKMERKTHDEILQ